MRFYRLLLIFLAALTIAPPAIAQGLFASPPDLATQTALASMQTAAACKWTYVAGANVTITNTIVETSVASAPQQGSLTIPACATTGAYTVQIHVDGKYQAATVAPGNLIQNIKFNGTTVCRVTLGNLATTGATGLGAHGNAFIRVDSSGNATCSGFLGYQLTATAEAPGYWATVGTPTITPGSAVTIDYTGQWTTANAANSITATAVIGTIQR